MTPSSYVLLAVSAGSPPACKVIVSEVSLLILLQFCKIFSLLFSSQVIPLLMEQYSLRPQSSPRQFILNTLNKMVHAGFYGFTKETGNSILFRSNTA